MSCGVGRRCGSDPTLLWLWRRLVATALIRPLAWEPPYAVGAAQEIAKKKKKKEPGVPIMAQWKQIRLGTIRLWVLSLAHSVG